MSYTKVYKGQTFQPGTKFPKHCYFENCTFLATCEFEEGSHFINCTFKRCCPKHNTNAPSKVKKAIVENSTLESVHLDKETLGVNNKSTGYKVIDESWSRAGIVRGNTEKVCICYCIPPTECKQGVSIPPVDNGKPPINPVTNKCGVERCGENQGVGESNIKIGWQ